MNKDIKILYKTIEEEKFKKLTKVQKLSFPQEDLPRNFHCSKILFIPIKKKMDGYGMSACFLEVGGKWIRVTDYDCFRFKEPNYKIKGDFEYGGVQFFSEKGFIYNYGNDFECK